MSGYRLDDWGVILSRDTDISLHHYVQTGSDMHSTVQWVQGNISLGIKQSGHKVIHSPPDRKKIVLECLRTGC
jgi:hypothetical protein